MTMVIPATPGISTSLTDVTMGYGRSGFFSTSSGYGEARLWLAPSTCKDAGLLGLLYAGVEVMLFSPDVGYLSA